MSSGIPLRRGSFLHTISKGPRHSHKIRTPLSERTNRHGSAIYLTAGSITMSRAFAHAYSPAEQRVAGHTEPNAKLGVLFPLVVLYPPGVVLNKLLVRRRG